MESPNKNYERFFDKFKEHESKEIKEWNKTDILAYFCNKYYKKYNSEYIFKFNTPQPSKCFEVFNINKLTILLSSDPETLKLYIDWVYSEKVEKAKRKLTSISFLSNDLYLKEFKQKYLSGNISSLPNIDRTLELPESILVKIKSIDENILTYGDLAFILQSNSNIAKQIRDLDLDLSMINRVI